MSNQDNNGILACCYAFRALLTIWAKSKSKRAEVVNALLVSYFRNGDQSLFGGLNTAKDYLSGTAEEDAVLKAFHAEQHELKALRLRVKQKVAPILFGLTRLDMAFALLPFLEARLETELSEERVANDLNVKLQPLFRHLISGEWDDRFIREWLGTSGTQILATKWDAPPEEIEAYIGLIRGIEEERASRICGECDSLDILKMGESCPLCGNEDTIPFT